MKRLLFPLVLLLWTVAMQAVPAHPGTVKVQQPDGTYITLRLIGDEWRSVNTTVDGFSVVKDHRGYYVYAEKKNGLLQPTARIAHDVAERTADEQQYLAGMKKYQMPQMDAVSAAMKARVEAVGAQRRAQAHRATDYSKFKGLIILVQFNDKKFSRPDFYDILNDMVNQEGYTGYDSQQLTGSVHDYFSDNSDGKFKPKFDVVGPYTVDYSQYDCKLNGGKLEDVILAALDSADVDVNFKDYDGDGNNQVDLVFFVVAGNGAHYGDNDPNLWWPHRSMIYNPKATGDWRVFKDGVQLWDYASSVELAGLTSMPSTNHIDGIGTICHEFSHVLGLPDFYDSNYEEDGLSITPGLWSVMDEGCYCNDSFTPVGYSLYERYSVHFTDEPQTINAAGTYELNPLHLSKTGFRIDSPNKKEFFLFENRQKNDFKWDAYLPASGMLVYRVDKSSSYVWDANTVNAKSSRNYYELVRAGGVGSLDGRYDVFPGKGNVRSLHNGTTPANLMTWNGKPTQWGLVNINHVNGIVSFDVQDALKLTGLSLPDSVSLGVDFSRQLNAVFEPNYVEVPLTWSTSDKNIATVSDNGTVRGISEGECVVTATANDSISASCVVTVKTITGGTIAEFKAMKEEDETLLMLKSTEVLFAYQSRIYVRDSTGAITLNNIGISPVRNDRLSGLLYGKLTSLNNMLQLSPVTDITDVSTVNITTGDEVLPHVKMLVELTTDDYSDYVLVKGVKLVKDVFCYAVSGDRRVRVYNRFGNKGGSLPSNYDGKYYDVEAIFGTNRLNGNIIEELYLVKTPKEVDDPTGIVEVRRTVDSSRQPVYNLQGQRVNPATKGLLIRGGHKYLNK